MHCDGLSFVMEIRLFSPGLLTSALQSRSVSIYRKSSNKPLGTSLFFGFLHKGLFEVGGGLKIFFY